MVAAAALVAVAGACDSAGPERVTGVVVEVDGDLSTVRTFVLIADGARLTFRPGDGVSRFSGGAPLSHLNEHLRSGERVSIVYETHPDGLVAVEISDG